MYTLFTDETNLIATPEAKFFIYGGTIFPMDEMVALHDEIVQLREAAGYKDEELKFASSSKPKKVDPATFSRLKQDVIDAAIRHKVVFLANLVPHAIAKSQGSKKTTEFGINTIIGKFDRFLEERDSHGTVQIDRPPVENPHRLIEGLFSNGLVLPKETSPLRRIVSLSITSARASHFSSVTDIVLGGFRYCVNASEDTEAVRKLLPRIVVMMWGKVENRRKDIFERGFIVRPREIRARIQPVSATL